MLAKKADRPALWIVAGPNGSGKSTLYSDVAIEDFGRSIWIINPDQLARDIQLREGMILPNANLEAVKRIAKWLKTSISAYQTIGVETVLSTPKYRRLVRLAQNKSFEIRLIYVVLDDVEKNIARVRMRVRQGGHDVPETKIRARYERSLKQLPWFLLHADKAWIYDNSTTKPQLMATKQDDVITVYPAAFAHIRDIIADLDQAM